ncbi:MAG: nucleotidyltransferase family protein [Candidatus Omnitrophica bacterium]|nr:nucleotidyltransferase family protein [Candidatus Omnitrophota bacterium]
MKDIEEIKKKIVKILKKNKITKAGIFGSYARGEQKKNSDIDILVKPTKEMSLLDFVGIKLEIEDELGNKVDFVSYKTLHPRLKKQILNEEIRII